MNIIKGGVTAAKGFKAAGCEAQIKYKNGKKDMALVYSEKPCVTAGTFTTNKVFAAPVKWDRNIVYNEDFAQAVVVNPAVLPTHVQALKEITHVQKKQRQLQRFLMYRRMQYLSVQQVLSECSFLLTEYVQELKTLLQCLMIH